MGKMRDIIKKAKRAGARKGMLGLAWLVDHLPFPLIEGFIHFALAVGFLFALRHRRVARESLQLAFGPEKSKAEIEKIVRGCFRTFRQGAVDLMFYSRYPVKARGKFVIQGREHLDEALKKGRGAMMVTAHFGNFPIMMLALAQLGYKTNVIMRSARDEKIADYVLQVMDRVGVHTIYTHPRRACVQESIRVLRNNELLFVLLDQNFGSQGNVFVNFFGRKAATAPGPIILAQRTGAPILMAFSLMPEDGAQSVVIEPELSLVMGKDEEETTQINVARVTEVIERYIRAYPHEWGWMHRRWKSQKAESVTGEFTAAESF